jgi:hypothetical protein
MAMLYKVVRSANTAFYAGELEVAYFVLVDALRLFRRLDNKKAIGVASNNLGNTMLAICRQMDAKELDCVSGITKGQIVAKGVAYFHEAIELGEKAYDEFYNAQGWTPICLDFMQHLANRYFNRGQFLLTVKDAHDNPEELEELGMRDLQIARDMDLEVIAYGEDIGWASADRVEKLFNVQLVRLRGYNMLLGIGYPDEWEMEELFDEMFNTIKAEVKRESSELFAQVSVAGRMQQMETELMKFKLFVGDLETAAKIAIRMLQEDESVFVDAQAQAVEVLLLYADSAHFDDSSRSRIRNELQEYQDILEAVVDEQKQATIDDLENDTAISRSTGTRSSKMLGRRYSSHYWSLRDRSGRFVTMEDF